MPQGSLRAAAAFLLAAAAVTVPAVTAAAQERPVQERPVQERPFGAQTRGSAPPPPGGFELGGHQPPSSPALPASPPGEEAPALAPALVGPVAVVNAVAYQPLPASGPGVAVRLYDDTPDGRHLAARLHAALAAAGHPTAADTAGGAAGGSANAANWIMSFELGETQVSTPEPRGMVTLEGHSSSARAEEDYRARMNLYSGTGRDPGLLSGPGEAPRLSGPTVRFNLALNDGRNGQRLWDGWGTAQVGPDGPVAAAEAMIPLLVGLIGETVRATPMALNPGQ